MYDADYLKRVEKAIAEAREALTEPYDLGSIHVALTGDNSSDHNRPYILAKCSQCGAECVMAASRRSEMGHLALALAWHHCAAHGHAQDYPTLLAKSREDFPLPPEKVFATAHITDGSEVSNYDTPENLENWLDQYRNAGTLVTVDIHED